MLDGFMNSVVPKSVVLTIGGMTGFGTESSLLLIVGGDAEATIGDD